MGDLPLDPLGRYASGCLSNMTVAVILHTAPPPPSLTSQGRLVARCLTMACHVLSEEAGYLPQTGPDLGVLWPAFPGARTLRFSAWHGVFLPTHFPKYSHTTTTTAGGTLHARTTSSMRPAKPCRRVFSFSVISHLYTPLTALHTYHTLPHHLPPLPPHCPRSVHCTCTTKGEERLSPHEKLPRLNHTCIFNLHMQFGCPKTLHFLRLASPSLVPSFPATPGMTNLPSRSGMMRESWSTFHFPNMHIPAL